CGNGARRTLGDYW
nr:immunoglobulin heavy chain junction region [Macaca mulatta]MOX61892.1 immunoglobulin heavy chain junction region [Macaca mulatta]MOX63569.1 immunoglobulin heavy chain junction region [Macaca mulatta]MOX65911.1 immunoglobulin heavy chain junction region [Macaca mulatta]MOX65998.1 immunoglobulin heavy chain junction region [Macaca mulatta]